MSTKLLNYKRLWLLIGTMLVVLGSCLILLLRESAIEADQNNCYQRLSKNLGVQSSYGKIRSEIYSQLQNSLEPGMSHLEALAILEQFSPISTKWDMTRLDGGRNEYIILETCAFQRNNFPFLLSFSKDRIFEKIVNYVDD